MVSIAAEPPGSRAWGRWLLVAVAAGALLLGLGRLAEWLRAPAAPPAASPADPAREAALRRITSGPDQNYAQTVERLDIFIDQAAAGAAAAPDDWTVQQRHAQLLIERSRLTGSYTDAAGARAALARAFAVAAPGAGPHFVQAALDFRMHRLGPAAAQLDLIRNYAVPPDLSERAEQQAMRGDILFYGGDYAGALAAYDAADAIEPEVAAFRRAIYLSRTGDPDRADALFARIAETTTQRSGAFLSFMELQRGILDLERGRLADAQAHFRAADAIFPGHWLIEEHIAEVMTKQGDLAGAAARYQDIVRRTGHPEFMGALAGIAAAQGDTAAEQAWLARADAVWRERLALFPEASYGHALDHCIARGDWACALDLAARNHRARPFGESGVALAHALLHNGRGAEARALIDTVLASPWRTAELHWVAAEIYAAQGDAAAAAAQRRRSLAINPLAEDFFGE